MWRARPICCPRSQSRSDAVAADDEQAKEDKLRGQSTEQGADQTCQNALGPPLVRPSLSRRPSSRYRDSSISNG